MKKIILTFGMLAGLFFGANAGDKPEFPGGDAALKSYIEKNMQYPSHAKENGVEGIVNVQFTVFPDGTIGTIKIMRMVDPDLEQEAIRLVKTMPAWTPADKDGAPVEATAQIAVPFVLE
ncbi:MAG: energy transducer TonB [Muribaculaceae bacterium]|nr:energy transducer TonB [Muribaculaceae bacterium]MDE6009569.1 energy transducer TonB [Muribaculaceae bacterium]MDE6792436.1 energy transducer TonB [Muribaculaceae bacterium]